MPNIKDIKIMIVTPSFAGGGAERIAVNLASHYTEQGLDVVLVAFNGAGPYRKQVDSKVKVVDLQTRLRSSFFKINREIKKQNPTHILSVLRGGNIILGLSLFFNRKGRLVFREANTFDEIKRLGAIKRVFEFFKLRIGYIRADGVIANSNDTKQDLLNYKIKNDKQVKVISNPVFSSKYEALSMQENNHHWFNGDYKVVLNVGRLHPQKNHNFLIDSFTEVLKKVPDARLVILGEGKLREELEQKIDNFGLNDFVEIIPFQQNPWPFYANANVFALTSEWEGFGNVLVESLACGTPVVSVNCPGGPKSILNNGEYGVLVEPGNKSELAKQIIRVLENTDIFNRQKLIARGLEFSVEKIADEYFDFIVSGVTK